MRTAKRIIKWAIWTVITAYIAAVAIVHLPAVQEWIGSRVAKAVMQKLDTKVQIGRIYLGLPNRIVIDDLRLYDKQGRLMIRAGRAAAKVDYGEMVRNGRICVSSAQLFSMKAVFYKELGNEEKAKAFSQIIGVEPKQGKEIFLDLFLYSHGIAVLTATGKLSFDSRNLEKMLQNFLSAYVKQEREKAGISYGIQSLSN